MRQGKRLVHSGLDPRPMRTYSRWCACSSRQSYHRPGDEVLQYKLPGVLERDTSAGGLDDLHKSAHTKFGDLAGTPHQFRSQNEDT